MCVGNRILVNWEFFARARTAQRFCRLWGQNGQIVKGLGTGPA
jgi:hypothetical protein